jgi:hypothetical protein
LTALIDKGIAAKVTVAVNITWNKPGLTINTDAAEVEVGGATLNAVAVAWLNTGCSTYTGAAGIEIGESFCDACAVLSTAASIATANPARVDSRRAPPDTRAVLNTG